MSWQRFTAAQRRTRGGAPAITIPVNRSVPAYLNRAARELLGPHPRLDVFHDADEKKLGFLGTDSAEGLISITRGRFALGAIIAAVGVPAGKYPVAREKSTGIVSFCYRLGAGEAAA